MSTEFNRLKALCDARSFERETCTRCGGTGKHSWCQTYLDVCFKCAGNGQALTKRGQLAMEFFTASMCKPAEEIKVGDKIRDESSGKWRTITSIRDEGETVYLQSEMPHMTYGYKRRKDTPMRVSQAGLEKARKLLAAYDYQDTLTKAGKPRKRGKK